MTDDLYRITLAESSELKLHGTALLAEGGPNAAYRAAVLFHAAVRAERRALSVLEAPPREVRLRSAIEQCGLLIDGLDPTAVVARAWGEVLEASIQVDPPVAKALRGRIDPGVAAFLSDYGRAMEGAKELTAGLPTRTTKEPVRARVAKEIDRLLGRFPGDPHLWCAQSIVADQGQDDHLAWESVHRALELEPESPLYLTQELLLVPDVLPRQKALRHLDAAYARIQRDSDSDLCHAFARAALLLAKGARDTTLLDRALDVITLGASLPSDRPYLARWFRAARLIIRELLARREPKSELLYRAGLGELVTRPGENSDPVELLARGTRPFADRLRLTA